MLPAEFARGARQPDKEAQGTRCVMVRNEGDDLHVRTFGLASDVRIQRLHSQL